MYLELYWALELEMGDEAQITIVYSRPCEVSK